MGTNVSTNYITCPADPQKTLGIKLPFLVMIIKNLKKYFTFEVQVLDDKNVRRRFRASNYQVQLPPPFPTLLRPRCRPCRVLPPTLRTRHGGLRCKRRPFPCSSPFRFFFPFLSLWPPLQLLAGPCATASFGINARPRTSLSLL